jgi:uncharacterized protein YcbK (DUF882 family)
MDGATSILNRRKFIKASSKMAFSFLAISHLPCYALVAPPIDPLQDPQEKAIPKEKPKLPSQKITFYHTHTHERLTIAHIPGQCTLETCKVLNFFFRDFRTREQHTMDTALMDTLYYIQESLKGRGVFEVISGYRSLKTNQYLYKMGSGVSKQSLHMQGRAIDVRLSGLHTKKLRDTAIKLALGGVGYYPKSDFVHLDTGDIRTW